MQQIVHALPMRPTPMQPTSMRRVPMRRVAFTIMTLTSVVMGAERARATASSGCEAANGGSMNLDIAAGTSAIRQATLAQGEALTLSVSTRGTAVVALTSGAGSPRTLLSGRETSLAFIAPQSATYVFRVEAGSQAGAKLGVTCTSVAKAEANQSFLARRNAFLAERDPDRIRIDRAPAATRPADSAPIGSVDDVAPTSVTASVSVSELAAAMKPGSKAEPGILDFWFEGRYQTYEAVDDDRRQSDGNFSVMYLGSKYMLGPDIMLGALAQFDQTGEIASRYGTSVQASGWMAGPYVSVRFGPGVVFDGRAAWGVTENLPGGIAVDPTAADRRLLRGTLRGTRQVGSWTVAPSVGLSYVQETPVLQGVSISDSDVASPAGSGRLDVVPEVKRRFDLDSETYIEPRFAAGGFLSFDGMSGLDPVSASSEAPDLHWKAEAGVAVGKKDSVNLQATGGVETGGEAAADTWMGKFQLNMPLDK